MNCTGADNSPYPYFKFDKADKSKFVAYRENDLLLFKNQNGGRRSYKVVSIVHKKSEYTVGMGFFGTYATKYYDYDELAITFKNQDGKINEWLINYSKRPSFDSQAKPNYADVRLLSGMRVWEWNGSAGPVYPINLDDNSEIVSLVIGSQAIPNVQKISSDRLSKTKSVDADRLDWDVNAIYFSSRAGILGFTDVDGNVWLLTK